MMQKRRIIRLTALALVLACGAISSRAVSTTTTIRIEGMDCAKCTTSIEKKLKATEGVEEVRVSYEKKEAWIKYDDQKVTEARLREVINSAGFKAVGKSR